MNICLLDVYEEIFRTATFSYHSVKGTFARGSVTANQTASHVEQLLVMPGSRRAINIQFVVYIHICSISAIRFLCQKLENAGQYITS